MKRMTYKPLVITAACIAGLSLTLVSCNQASSDNIVQPVPETIASTFKAAHVDAIGAQALLKSKPETVVLDIRTPKEIDKGYIEGAKFADFYQEDFSEKLSKLDRDASYLVHCAGGGRSTKVLTTLEELGFKNVTHLDGGIKGWTKADLPLSRP